MPNISIEFLQRISGPKSRLKTLPPYTLNNDYKNKVHQQILEAAFGKEGYVSTVITENEVLSYAQRSFYLKVACLATEQECGQILDRVYAAVKAKRPGHYWDLLIAIKRINNHCNDTGAENWVADLMSQTTTHNALLFKHKAAGDPDIRPQAIWLAILNLLKPQVEWMALRARVTGAGDSYGSDQCNFARELDGLTPDPTWRLLLNDLTCAQFAQSMSPVIYTAHSEMHRKLNEWLEHSQKLADVLVPTTVENYQQKRLAIVMQLMQDFNRREIRKRDLAQERMSLEDRTRYTRELAEKQPAVVAPTRAVPVHGTEGMWWGWRLFPRQVFSICMASDDAEAAPASSRAAPISP